MSCLEDDLCQARIAFLGRVVADASHEIQNHFAVIKEYNGLIADLLRSDQQDPGSCVDRCREITGSINDRARLAADMVDVLNRFSHRGDTARSDFRVEELVEDIVSLLHRSAVRKKIILEASHGRKIPEISSDASLLQFLIYSLIAPMIDELPENGSISVITQRGKGKIPQIAMTFEGGVPSIIEQDLMAPELLSACLSRLEGSFAIEASGRKPPRMLITIPSLS